MLDCWIVRMTAVLSVICPAFSETQFSLRKRRDSESCNKGINLQIQRTTTNNETASIYCPDLKNEEEDVNFSLHKFEDFNRTQALTSLKPSRRFYLSTEKNKVHYLIRMLKVNDTGLYCCGVWPDRTAYTLLLVEESCPREGKPLSWIMLAAGCGLFALYNLIVTTVACYFGRKLKNAEMETQSDYYNTRPGEFRRVR